MDGEPEYEVIDHLDIHNLSRKHPHAVDGLDIQLQKGSETKSYPLIVTISACPTQRVHSARPPHNETTNPEQVQQTTPIRNPSPPSLQNPHVKTKECPEQSSSIPPFPIDALEIVPAPPHNSQRIPNRTHNTITAASLAPVTLPLSRPMQRPPKHPLPLRNLSPHLPLLLLLLLLRAESMSGAVHLALPGCGAASGARGACGLVVGDVGGAEAPFGQRGAAHYGLEGEGFEGGV
ncbi:hypothetical protein M501DRAFT_1061233 [Patellaria atrata CBS 101060]|uniref:Uncharacterized protein n=1 Tax=Patellaria atrata CBS 101060 TaxID=1346257 RepID=A0A9P4VP26_9PEZI|nr:hypothetical protein M501DRAFT_1061233 [Patellaria atrata CBS 101060]